MESNGGPRARPSVSVIALRPGDVMLRIALSGTATSSALVCKHYGEFDVLCKQLGVATPWDKLMDGSSSKAQCAQAERFIATLLDSAASHEEIQLVSSFFDLSSLEPHLLAAETKSQDAIMQATRRADAAEKFAATSAATAEQLRGELRTLEGRYTAAVLAAAGAGRGGDLQTHELAATAAQALTEVETQRARTEIRASKAEAKVRELEARVAALLASSSCETTKEVNGHDASPAAVAVQRAVERADAAEQRALAAEAALKTAQQDTAAAMEAAAAAAEAAGLGPSRLLAEQATSPSAYNLSGLLQALSDAEAAREAQDASTAEAERRRCEAEAFAADAARAIAEAESLRAQQQIAATEAEERAAVAEERAAAEEERAVAAEARATDVATRAHAQLADMSRELEQARAAALAAALAPKPTLSQLLPRRDDALRSLRASVGRAARSPAGRWHFDIRVSCVGTTYTIPRRYRDFFALHSALRNAALTLRLPRLPPKRAHRSQDDAFAEKRRSELDVYLQALILLNETRYMAPLQTFLELGVLVASPDGGRESERSVASAFDLASISNNPFEGPVVTPATSLNDVAAVETNLFD